MKTEDLWKKASSIIDVTEKHPFLVAMVDGTLSIDSFRYYVVQDALYLQDFGNCLYRLSQTVGISEISSNRLIQFTKGIEHAELLLHNSFFKQWNINSIGVQQMPNTLLYTSYMKRIVATCTYAEGLACLLPCFWVYAHVGTVMLQLREQLGDSVQRSKQYDAWIDMYGGDDFGKEVEEYKQLVDDAFVTADVKTQQSMAEHFIMCCKLEYMFWDQASICMEWPKIL